MSLQFQANLPVTILREGDQFVAHTPALDLSTSGDTLEQAQSRFAEAVEVFFEECHKMGTLDEVLTELGWTRQNNHLTPPVVVDQALQSVSLPVFT